MLGEVQECHLSFEYSYHTQQGFGRRVAANWRLATTKISNVKENFNYRHVTPHQNEEVNINKAQLVCTIVTFLTVCPWIKIMKNGSKLKKFHGYNKSDIPVISATPKPSASLRECEVFFPELCNLKVKTCLSTQGIVLYICTPEI